jgi:hypothetical protein
MKEKVLPEVIKVLAESQTPNTICVDVPLFIRLLEFAREDAKSDMSLHTMTENILDLHSKGTPILSMKNYNSIIK